MHHARNWRARADNRPALLDHAEVPPSPRLSLPRGSSAPCPHDRVRARRHHGDVRAQSRISFGVRHAVRLGECRLRRKIGGWSRASCHLPRLNDVDPWLVGEDWSSCALVRIRKPLDQSVFIVVNDKLLPNPAVILDRDPISHCSPTALLGVVLFFLAEAVEERAAIMVEGGATHIDAPILFRALLVPLSEDNHTVEAVLITSNFRERREGELASTMTRRVWSCPFASAAREAARWRNQEGPWLIIAHRLLHPVAPN